MGGGGGRGREEGKAGVGSRRPVYVVHGSVELYVNNFGTLMVAADGLCDTDI